MNLLSFLTLPFEVHYSGAVAITQFEMVSDELPKRFSGIKMVHEQGGYAFGVTFRCTNNHGDELMYCLTNKHGEVAPPWLELVDEDRADFNYGRYHSVAVKNDEIYLEPLAYQEDIEVDDMESLDLDVLFDYWIGDVLPHHYVLDAEGSRVRVDYEGFVLNDDGSRSEVRLFDTESIHKVWGQWYSEGIVKYELFECETVDIFDSQFQWIKRILNTRFPQDSKLQLA